MGNIVSRSVSFNPSTDIPSLKGKVILVTGGNSGLGKESILELSKHNPKEIWLAARDTDKANAAINGIQQQGGNGSIIRVIELDLMSFESISKAADTIKAQTSRLDILMLNAGIMAFPAALTNDGYEVQFGTNHMGHAMLTKLLLPLLLKTAELVGVGSDAPRVVVLASYAHSYAPTGGALFDTLKNRAEGMGTVTRYGQSKLANILYGRELSKHYKELVVPAVHPGMVRTQLANTMSAGNFIMMFLWKLTSAFTGVEPSRGALNQLWAATTNGVRSGEYYELVGIANRGSKYTRDDRLAKKLWDWTEDELNQYLVR